MSPFIRDVLQDFISLLQSSSTSSTGLLSAISQLDSQKDSNFSRLTPSIGHAFRATLAPTLFDPIPVAVELVCDFLQELPSFLFTSVFREPVGLRVDPVILPDTLDVSLTWQPPNLEVVTRGYVASFVISEECRTLTRFVPLECGRLSTFSSIGCFKVLAHHERSAFPPLDSQPAQLNGSESVSNLESANDLLSEATPEYAAWITPVVRYLVLTTPPASGFTSGSDRFNAGVVAMSYPIDVVSVAESLVHEAAHQYYFLLESMDELCDPDHDVLYYSPLRKSKRALNNILLAYHAAANILCFYQLLRARKARYQPEAAELRRVVDDVETLAAHLSNNSALTDTGRSLFESLYKLIMQNGWAET
jgi:hypothetical protein